MTDERGDYIDAERRYSVVRELGRGGMGVVYEVVDHHADGCPHIALKLASNDTLVRESSWRRLEAEFLYARRIRSDWTIEVFERGVSSHGAPFFTMELLDGEPLSASLSRRANVEPFSVPEILGLLTQIAEGLRPIHQAGLVYGDLKPANVLLKTQGSHHRIRLIDFGVTCEAASLTADSSLEDSTSTGMIGTSFYMSPEQIQGLPLTIHSDIYSFGVLAFQLCTGRLPFDADDLFAVTTRHLLAKASSVRELNRAIPRGLERIIQVALEKHPADRYADASEILSRLNALSTRPSLGTTVKRVLSWIRR